MSFEEFTVKLACGSLKASQKKELIRSLTDSELRHITHIILLAPQHYPILRFLCRDLYTETKRKVRASSPLLRKLYAQQIRQLKLLLCYWVCETQKEGIVQVLCSA